MQVDQILWNSALDVIDKTFKHPFCIELAQGDLSLKSFSSYLQQDSLYIRNYAIAMNLLSDKAPTSDLKKEFQKLAIDSYDLENDLQEVFFKEFNISHDFEINQACLNYSNHIIDTTKNGTFCEGLTALLPCFWVYLENGKKISGNRVSHNVYQKWIDTYVCDEFIEQTERMKKYLNFYYHQESVDIEVLKHIFRKSCILDQSFFSSVMK